MYVKLYRYNEIRNDDANTIHNMTTHPEAQGLSCWIGLAKFTQALHTD